MAPNASSSPGASRLVRRRVRSSVADGTDAPAGWRTVVSANTLLGSSGPEPDRLPDPASAEPSVETRAFPDGAGPDAVNPDVVFRPVVTSALIAGISVVSAFELVSAGVQAAVTAAGLVKPDVRAGEWWRLLTSTYLHGSILHLFGNMSVLFAFGSAIEARAPRTRVLVVYLCAALAGGACSLWVRPHAASIGASGGVIGVLGYLLVLSLRRPGEVPAHLRSQVLGVLGATALLGLFGFWFLDNAAHAGGLVAGLAIGYLVIPAAAITRPRAPRLSTAAGWLAAAILIGGAAFTAERLLHPRTPPPAKTLVSRGAAGPLIPVESIRAEVATAFGQATVTVENLRDVPLEAWSIDIFASPGDTSPIVGQLVDACCLRALDPVQPIAPHETRQFVFNRVGGSRAFVARIELVLYQDGYYEGFSAEHERVLVRRDRAASSAAYWMGAIDEALAQPGLPGRAALAAHLAATSVGPASTGQAFRGDIARVLNSASQGNDRFVEAAQQERATLQRQRDALLNQTATPK